MTDIYNPEFDGLVKAIAGAHWSSSRISVNLDGLKDNMGQYASAVEALKTWTAFTGLTFDIVSGKAASITVDNSYQAAFSQQDVDWATGTMLKAYVNVDGNWPFYAPDSNNRWAKGYYGFQTFVHEFGHALGLEHPGAYNGGTPNYWTDARFSIDTWQYSVMSYFLQGNHPQNGASDMYLVGPMMADIEAIRTLYGPLAVNTGNTVYGKGETFIGGWTDIGLHERATYCINDTGGRDLMDYSDVDYGTTMDNGLDANRIDMRDGYFSDIGGFTGNVSISKGTIIEDLNGTGVIDLIHGNAVANVISGLGGDDIIMAGDGNDRVLGGDGNDYIEGNEGNDALDGGAGNDTFYGGGGRDTIDGGEGADFMEGGSEGDTYTVDNAGDVVSEYSNGNVGHDDLIRQASDWIGFSNPSSQGANSDRVNATISQALADNVEELALRGNGAIDGTGNDLDNFITGNGNNNILKGLAGSDRLWAGAGSDTLDGGTGDDWLDGGYNHDTMTGGTGNDAFVFGARFSTSGNGATWGTLNVSSDLVKDFVHGEDMIVLSRTAFSQLAAKDPFNAKSLLLTARDAVTAATRVVYDQTSGKLWYDADGSGTGFNKVLIATFENKALLSASDFMAIA